MCGRYSAPDTAAIEARWHIGRHNSNPFRRRFNVLPTTTIPIIRRALDCDELELTEARWGFAPGWWKKPKPPTSCFNARSEEAAGKPMWRQSYSKARCLIPAEGWFEWQAVERADPETGEIKTYKQPHFIHAPDGRCIAFAGLMSLWYPAPDAPVLTCAILTRAAAPSMSDVHDRMPVILPDSVISDWLDPRVQRTDEVAEMVAYAQGEFAHFAVTPRLNAAKTDDEEFIKPLVALPA